MSQEWHLCHNSDGWYWGYVEEGRVYYYSYGGSITTNGESRMHFASAHLANDRLALHLDESRSSADWQISVNETSFNTPRFYIHKYVGGAKDKYLSKSGKMLDSPAHDDGAGYFSLRLQAQRVMKQYGKPEKLAQSYQWEIANYGGSRFWAQQPNTAVDSYLGETGVVNGFVNRKVYGSCSDANNAIIRANNENAKYPAHVIHATMENGYVIYTISTYERGYYRFLHSDGEIRDTPSPARTGQYKTRRDAVAAIEKRTLVNTPTKLKSPRKHKMSLREAYQKRFVCKEAQAVLLGAYRAHTKATKKKISQAFVNFWASEYMNKR
jgi:hypothetical protein